MNIKNKDIKYYLRSLRFPQIRDRKLRCHNKFEFFPLTLAAPLVGVCKDYPIFKCDDLFSSSWSHLHEKKFNNFINKKKRKVSIFLMHKIFLFSFQFFTSIFTQECIPRERKRIRVHFIPTWNDCTSYQSDIITGICIKVTVKSVVEMKTFIMRIAFLHILHFFET